MIKSTDSHDPLNLAALLWPDVYFYREQQQIIESVWNNDETVVPAGNQLGKDFVAGRAIVLFFLMHYTCRIVTTSVTDRHLNVLWAEIERAVLDSAVPLVSKRGGPLVCDHHRMRKVYNGVVDPTCYVIGVVTRTERPETLQGHHADHTLFVADEASGIPEPFFTMARPWASGGPGRKRMLIFGNPWPCQNYFFRAVEGDPATNDVGGDILAT